MLLYYTKISFQGDNMQASLDGLSYGLPKPEKDRQEPAMAMAMRLWAVPPPRVEQVSWLRRGGWLAVLWLAREQLNNPLESIVISGVFNLYIYKNITK